MVAPLDLDALHAIYRLRRTLEPELARRSCVQITDDELDRLHHQAVGFGDEHFSMDAIYEGTTPSTSPSSRPPRPAGTCGS